MSFARPTLSSIFARIGADITSRLPGSDSRLARSVLNVLAKVLSGGFDGLYGYLGSIALDVMPDTASSDHLRRWASIWGVVPKGAAPARGMVALTGISGAAIIAGSILQRADGAQFTVDALTLLVGGAGSANVTAVVVGSTGNAIVGTPLAFTSPSTGVGALATVGVAGLGGGIDDETDASLLGRLLARIQSPPQGGSANDYIEWALACPEVTRAWVYPGWLGAGSVGVAVVMDGRADIFPLAADIARIQAALTILKPVTAILTVFAPIAMPTPFTLHIVPSTTVTQAAVLAELNDLYTREAQAGGTILLSQIREAIATAAGVTDYALVVPAADIVAPKGQMPAIGAVSFV